MNTDKDFHVHESETDSLTAVSERPATSPSIAATASLVAIRAVEGRIEQSLALADDVLTSLESDTPANSANSATLRSSAAPEVTVVIPVYNEQKTVTEVIDRVLALPISLEVIVVDDGSSDGTRDALAQYNDHPRVRVLLHEINQGKGAALRTGIARAQGDYVVIQDADLEYDPSNILSVLKPLQAGLTEAAYGSRYLLQTKQDRSFIHRLGNWGLTTFSNLLARQSLTDMETCYKAFRRELIQSIHIEENRFGFEPEITAKLARTHTQICEVPISYHPRSWKEGKKIGIKDLLRTLYCIVKYNLR
jgi:glycosyltransferase involved in cell wall biosynthesis